MILSVLSLLWSVTVHADAQWGGANDPAIFDANYSYNLNSLPREGFLPSEKMPWSETYWPSKKGSINIRWNSPEMRGFNYKSPTRDQVRNMSKEQLAQLSPSEKYDIFMGNYDYPLKKDVSRIATPMAKWWSGVCHGWSPVALQYREPQPVEMTNPDGVVVPFGSSDIKGLMSYAAAIHADVDPVQVGLKCNKAGWAFQTPACRDVNPGAVHVILANQLGIKKEGFVAQRDPTGEIWNQPVYGFKSELVGSAKPHDEKSASGVQVHAVMYYADELEKSLWEPVTGTPQFVEGKMEMNYVLDLDSRGNIVGGVWLDKTHPDFFWKATKKIEFTGIMEGVNKLYKPVN